jgi:hypothetical protein
MAIMALLRVVNATQLAVRETRAFPSMAAAKARSPRWAALHESRSAQGVFLKLHSKPEHEPEMQAIVSSCVFEPFTNACSTRL